MIRQLVPDDDASACGPCGRVFRSEQAFRAHRVRGVCVDPAELGMFRIAGGGEVWAVASAAGRLVQPSLVDLW